MTREEILLVQRSWRKVLSLGEAAPALFYRELFDIDPTLRGLFKGDLALQGVKLTEMISTAVRGLDQLDVLLPAVRSLGRRHASYGVRDEHYATVATALLRTLEKGLGSDFTPQTRTAWIEIYGVLSRVMRNASNPPWAA